MITNNLTTKDEKDRTLSHLLKNTDFFSLNYENLEICRIYK